MAGGKVVTYRKTNRSKTMALPSSALTIESRSEIHAGSASLGSVKAVRSTASADTPAVERDAHPRPEVDVEHERFGHDVVELLVEPGDVGEHPGDAGAPGAGGLRR